jgi:hypothetical protein
MTLLDRRIASYWNRKARDEQQREKVRQSLNQFNNSWNRDPVNNLAQKVEEPQTVSPSFLAQVE